MSNAASETRTGRWIAICAIAALVPCSLVHAGRTNIEERRPADPQGEVEIVNVSGKVEVQGWDRAEVEVSGSVGANVDRVDVSGTGNHTAIHVLSRSAHSWNSDGEANLLIHVPAKSAVTASLVSADFKVMSVAGDVKLQSVSGDVSGDVGGDVRVTTVSGEVRMAARAAKTIEMKTISGDIQLRGGGGAVDITTVSGSATVELANVRRGRFKSVSGDLTAELALAPDGQIESEAVSGDVSMNFAGAPAAEFDVQSFSGDIRNCFGPKPVESRYGPGSRLQFKNGDGHAQVQIHTKSGDVHLCAKGMNSGYAAPRPVARVARLPIVVPYVF